jgi:superfamily II DNA or RNA helicase
MLLVGYESRKEQIKELLTYKDEKVDWAFRKMQKNHWLRQKIGDLEFNKKLQELRNEIYKCLLFEDENGLWTYSGLRDLFIKEFGDTCKIEYDLPDTKAIPWHKIPEDNPRYYQVEAEKAIVESNINGPVAIELATGSGKSLLARNLIKHYGLQTILMTPSVSIAHQMYDDLVLHFGKGKVGLFGGGKKEFNKLITVSIGASLTRLEPEDEAYKKLSQAKVYISDESHTNGCVTLSKVCFGIASNIPYRIFLSGTQFRNDGADLLLEGIIGPIVYKKNVQELVDGGFLAKPLFRMCWVESNVRDKNGNLYYSSDANEMTREHVFYNKELNKKVAELANKSVALMSRPVVILIEELEQFAYLIPYLNYETKFAHAGVTAANKKFVPEAYHVSNPKQLVHDFNEGKYPILVGTSCIGVGTNIKPVKTIISLKGGKSDVEINQNVGRGTRLHIGKEDFLYIDIGIKNVEMLEKHAKSRIKTLNGIYPSLSEIKL